MFNFWWLFLTSNQCPISGNNRRNLGDFQAGGGGRRWILCCWRRFAVPPAAITIASGSLSPFGNSFTEVQRITRTKILRNRWSLQANASLKMQPSPLLWQQKLSSPQAAVFEQFVPPPPQQKGGRTLWWRYSSWHEIYVVNTGEKVEVVITKIIVIKISICSFYVAFYSFIFVLFFIT